MLACYRGHRSGKQQKKNIEKKVTGSHKITEKRHLADLISLIQWDDATGRRRGKHMRKNFCGRLESFCAKEKNGSSNWEMSRGNRSQCEFQSILWWQWNFLNFDWMLCNFMLSSSTTFRRLFGNFKQIMFYYGPSRTTSQWWLICLKLPQRNTDAIAELFWIVADLWVSYCSSEFNFANKFLNLEEDCRHVRLKNE